MFIIDRIRTLHNTGDKLLEERNKRLVVFPCCDSFVHNKRFGLYKEPASRPCKNRNLFIGIYTKKQVLFVGKIESIVSCKYQNGEITAEAESGIFTLEQRTRVIEAIETISYHEKLKTDPHRFYFVNEFAETDLRKISPGGMRTFRYYDLSDIARGDFDPHANYTSAQLANLLRGKTFK